MHRWKLSALAAAALVTAAMTSTDAAALALGPLRVDSALGENLRAEIAIPQATEAELNNLVAQIASAEIFRAQGMDYSAAARAIQIQLMRKADGTASLRLTSSAPLQDPFVDLVVETLWSTGHLVRSYTLLLDPPAAQRTTPAITIAPQITPAPSTAQTPRPNNAARSRAITATPAAVPAPVSTDHSTRVRSGDTAGRIANTNRPAGVSLDQMLVAMLRSNPEAFINGNVNRIRAGAVVQMPNREQALETSAPEARKIVAAQSRDFNAYRRSLASKAPQATVQAADRSASGQVQAHVEDARPAAETPDKLTLSKGTVQGTAAAEEKLASQKQADDQDNRLSELQRNLTELNALAGNTSHAAPGSTSATAETGPPPSDTAPTPTDILASAAPSIEVAGTPGTASAAPSTADTTTAAAPLTEPSPSSSPDNAASPATVTPPEAKAAPAAQPAPPAAAPATPVTAPSLSDEWLANPLVPAGAGLVALLLGLLGYTAWKRRRAAQAAQDPGLGDSQLQPDSFFGGSGGQQVDTSSADDGASTMAYAPSQLDGGGDVDPVAEADVYLAYGRDVQAEEILKEALRSQPERLSVHVKLAEIYDKRNDIQALESTARALQAVSKGQGPEWQRVVDMGRQMDANNLFFATAGASSATTGNPPTSTFANALNAVKTDLPSASMAAATSAAVSSAPHLDLDFDLSNEAFSAQPNPNAAPAATVPQHSDNDFAALELPSTWDSQLDLTAAPVAEDPPTLVQDTLMDESQGTHDLSDLDLDLSGFEVTAPVPSPAPLQPADKDIGDALNFDLDSPLPPVQQASAPSVPVAPAPFPAASDGLDFDLSSLDLDLGASETPAEPAPPVHNLADDPLATKLDLAQEFNSIGDSEGARALIEEVLAEAGGPLKERAQKMLSEID